MTTREQDNQIERLAEKHGRVMVRDGYVGGHIFVTFPDLSQHRIKSNGLMEDVQIDASQEAVMWMANKL